MTAHDVEAMAERLGAYCERSDLGAEACQPNEPCPVCRAAAMLRALQAENERLRGLVSSYRLQIDQLHDRNALAGGTNDAEG